jgi:hypothetical protein
MLTRFSPPSQLRSPLTLARRRSTPVRAPSARGNGRVCRGCVRLVNRAQQHQAATQLNRERVDSAVSQRRSGVYCDLRTALAAAVRMSVRVHLDAARETCGIGGRTRVPRCMRRAGRAVERMLGLLVRLSLTHEGARAAMASRYIGFAEPHFAPLDLFFQPALFPEDTGLRRHYGVRQGPEDPGECSTRTASACATRSPTAPEELGCRMGVWCSGSPVVKAGETAMGAWGWRRVLPVHLHAWLVHWAPSDARSPWPPIPTRSVGEEHAAPRAAKMLVARQGRCCSMWGSTPIPNGPAGGGSPDLRVAAKPQRALTRCGGGSHPHESCGWGWDSVRCGRVVNPAAQA